MKIGIIGTGAYAIALTSLLENKKLDITMWTKFENEYQELTNNHTNLNFLNYKIDKNIKFTMNLDEIIKKDLIIIAIPAKFIKQTLDDLKGKILNQHILIATKGFEHQTNCLIHEYLQKELGIKNIACISGPSFAKDIIEKEVLGLTIGATNKKTLTIVKNCLEVPYLTFDTTNDIIGIELCGTLKNIIAVATGILNGLNVNSSSKAKFLVESIRQIKEIIKLFNGKPNTFNTYAGIGDLILTATSLESRNYTYGTLIGENRDYQDYLANTTVEGFENLKTLHKIMQEKKLNNDFIETLYKIICLHKNPNLILDLLKD